MKFVFEPNRTASEERVLKSALKSQWAVSDVFTRGQTCEFKTEAERLKWAPVLASLAFGEGTAFYGFGNRIAEADDISAKSWLAVHLLDEARHTEGFSELLTYLYPSYAGRHEELLRSRDVFVFYGHTHKCERLVDWLLCTQIAEVFGRQCYSALYDKLNRDDTAGMFLRHILQDEHRHIAYISSLIETRRQAMPESTWRQEVVPFAEKMIGLARNMFEAKRRGANYKAFESLEIDVSAFCDKAAQEIEEKFCQKASPAGISL